MQTLVLRNAYNGKCTDINDVDLDVLTPSQLIGAAIDNLVLEKVEGEEYRVIGKNNQPVTDDVPLSKLGFVDGDTITVVSKPTGAARL